jgi:hypothetical protein
METNTKLQNACCHLFQGIDYGYPQSWNVKAHDVSTDTTVLWKIKCITSLLTKMTLLLAKGSFK